MRHVCAGSLASQQHLRSLRLRFDREPLLWAMYDGVWSLALCRDRSAVPLGALQAHGSADTAPSKELYEQPFRENFRLPL